MEEIRKVRLQFPFFILFIHPNLCVAYHFLGGCFLTMFIYICIFMYLFVKKNVVHDGMRDCYHSVILILVI